MVHDGTVRFTSRVDRYVRYRPGYPAEVLRTLVHECGLSPSHVVADLGSGTGIFTKVLLDHGCTVFGVEPNAAMREAAEHALAGHARFTSVDATAEATGLEGHAFDFVTAAQAAHWFSRDRARAELVRILRPGGFSVLVWNERKIGTTPFLAAYERMLLTHGTDYAEVRHERTTDVIDAFFAPSPFEVRVFRNAQEVDYDGLEGRLLSSSYTPAEGHPSHAPMLAELRRIFDEHQERGRVVLEYDTRVYFARLS